MTDHPGIPDPVAVQGENTVMSTTADLLAEVPVAKSVLDATADLLAQLAEFFDLHPQARVALGHFLAARDEDAGDAAVEGSVTAHELTEAAELLRGLAGAGQEG